MGFGMRQEIGAGTVLPAGGVAEAERTKVVKRDMCWIYLDVSENNGTPKSSILVGFSIINHPFWGAPIFGNTHLDDHEIYYPRKFHYTERRSDQ